MTNELLPRHCIANLTLASWLAADAVRAFIFANSLQEDYADLMAGVLFLITGFFVLCRSQPLAQDNRIGTVVLALTAAIIPLLVQWTASAPERTEFLVVGEGTALLMMGAGLFYLRKNFSIVPQYRGIVSRGPYAVVRHPIYASYLIFDGALVVAAHSWFAAAMWFAEGALLMLRAEYEERLLASSDQAYNRYKKRVRWRFVPGLV